MSDRLVFTVMTPGELAAKPLFVDHLRDPVMGGMLQVVWCEEGLVRLSQGEQTYSSAMPMPGMALTRFPGLAACLAGEIAHEPLPLVVSGTPFQRSVWQRIAAIPHGVTISYSRLAADAGKANAMRAAGTACGRNPLPRIIPCHRVLGSCGQLGGFVFGTEMKRRLLAFEARQTTLLAA